MIRLLLRLPVALVLVLTVVWATVLGMSRDPESIVAGGLAQLTSAYPEFKARKDFLNEWGSLPGDWTRPLSSLGGEASALGKAGLLVSRFHLGALLRLAPVLLCLMAAGVVSGLVLRERMREAEGYASPTAAGIARALVGTGLFWLALFATSPIPVSYAWLSLAGMASAVGAALYAANLPLKL
ncbi:MAG TPA: hypothetical protein VKU80_12555 [Planctomycetota bacterium]|nr:hypothetical protein [Planctomycetota bacterium]